jgi:3-methyladenine DNA glycosylase AlkD
LVDDEKPRDHTKRMLAARIVAQLRRKGDAAVAAQQVAYMKGVTEFLGLTAPQTAEVFKTFVPEVKELGDEEKMVLGRELLRSGFYEVKDCGLKVWGIAAKVEANAARLLTLCREAIDAGDARSWATVDIMCSSVLHPVIMADASHAAEVANWSTLSADPAAAPEFLNRASCVAFIRAASPRHGGRYHADCWRAIDRVVRDPRRFAQLGAGWLLRVLSETDQARVEAYVRPLATSGVLSREGLRYAIEKFPPVPRSTILRDTAPSRKRARDESSEGREE